ncbi:MAG: thiamine diphosphokinase [Acutalibacteraceae bacterium]|nr:thiamine diphosphokinase [Acutalibacteraceae bacterium]
MSICCIVGAGDCNKFDYIKQPDDLVIAADGGYNHLKKYGIEPDIIIGDFDSLGYVPDNTNVIKLPVVKDITDMFAAAEIGLKKGFDEFCIYGACGGRLDHTISNIQLAVSLVQKGKKCVIYDSETEITAVHNGVIELPVKPKGYISVFSHSDKCTGVTIRGLKYNVENVTFANSFPLGVSNEFIGEKASVSVIDGTLVIIY